MKKNTIQLRLLLCSFIFATISSCTTKEQINVFDANMVVRNASETEDIARTINEHKEKCKENKDEIERLIK